MLWCCDYVVCICVCNEVWWCPYPTILRPPFQDKDADENVDADHVRTERPVYEQPLGLFTQCEDKDIDFRVSGLPHAVVKQAGNFRVRELVKKIASHPHRQAHQADLQQMNVNNPFSDDSKVMIRDLGNVELFDLCETIPKVQCSECLLCWNQGVVCCTCGQLSKEIQSRQHFHQWRLDAFSIQNYVIKKVRPRSTRHGKTEAQYEHCKAHNARRRCLKKKFEGIHDRFQRYSTCRDSQLEIGWTEVKCIEMDKVAQEDHSSCPLPEEFDRNRKNGNITLNKPRRNEPMKLRPHFPRSTYKNMHRLHRESGKEQPEPIPLYQYQGGIGRLLHSVPHGGTGMNTGGAQKIKIVNYL